MSRNLSYRLFSSLVPAFAFCAISAPSAIAQDGDDGVLVLEEETTVSDAAIQRWFDESQALMGQKRYLPAAIKLNDIVRQGFSGSPTVKQAEYLLGVSLYELALYQSAFTSFERIAEQGDSHPRYADTLGYLLKLARATANDPSVVLKIAEYPDEIYPAADADELHFLVGRYYFDEEDLAEALTRFQTVSQDDATLYVRARYLEGVILVAQSNLGSERNLNADKLLQAGECFKDVMRVQRDRTSNAVIDRVAAEALLALGRLFYSTRQYDVAVSYYEEVDPTNPHWLDSIYEVAWVQFQLKNYPKALGLLHSVNSPYFNNRYFPESRVLQALILFYNCHYDEADNIIKAFVNDYYPLMSQLKAEINMFTDPNAFYSWLARLSRTDDTEYSLRFRRIFDAALRDKKLRRKFELVATLNDEVARLDEISSVEGSQALVGDLKGDIDAYRSLVIGDAGSLAQDRLQRIVEDLQSYLASALKIKGETLRARRGDISNAAAQEQAAAAAAPKLLVVDDEHIEWPYEGEYWIDELDSYFFDIQTQCNVPESQ